jgi:hypothetical protein
LRRHYKKRGKDEMEVNLANWEKGIDKRGEMEAGDLEK